MSTGYLLATPVDEHLAGIEINSGLTPNAYISVYAQSIGVDRGSGTTQYAHVHVLIDERF